MGSKGEVEMDTRGLGVGDKADGRFQFPEKKRRSVYWVVWGYFLALLMFKGSEVNARN